MDKTATFMPAVTTTRQVNMNDLKTIGHVKLVKHKDPKPAQQTIIYTKLDGFSCDGN
jgi:hypothetical protein